MGGPPSETAHAYRRPRRADEVGSAAFAAASTRDSAQSDITLRRLTRPSAPGNYAGPSVSKSISNVVEERSALEEPQMEWQSPDKEGHRRAELGLEAAGNARSAGGTRATGVAPRRAGSQRRRGATPRDVAAVTDSGRVPEPSKNSFEEPIFCRQGNSVEEGDLVSSIIGTEQGEQPQMWAPELSSDATEQNSSNDEDVEEGTKSDGSGGANSDQLDSTRAPHSSALCARSPVPRSSVSVAPFRATSGSQDSLSSCQITVEGKPLVKPRVQPRQKVRPSHRLENETDLEEKETTRQVGNRGNSLFGGFLRSLSRRYAEAIHLLDGLDDDSNSNTSLSRHASATNSRGPLAELSSRASSARNQAPGAAPEIGRSRPRPWRRAPGEGRQSPTGDSERASKNKKSGVFPTTLRSLFSFSSSSCKKPPPGERGEANVERPPPSTSSPELVSGGSESSGVLRRHANRGARTAQRRSFLGSVAAAASGAFAEAGAVAAAAAAAVAAVGESSTDYSSDSSVVGEPARPGRFTWSHEGEGIRKPMSRSRSRSQHFFAYARAVGWASGERVEEEDEPSESSSGDNEDEDILVLQGQATPFEFVLWAARDAAASLQRPLLSAPVEEDSEAAEGLRRTESMINRRERVRLSRLRAVALRLLLYISEDDSWCRSKSKARPEGTGAIRCSSILVGNTEQRQTDEDSPAVTGEMEDDMAVIETLWDRWLTEPAGAGQHGREQEQEKSTRKKEGDLENRVSRKRLMWKAAHRIREVDSRLSRLHFDIVPRRLKEEDFWKLYFYQVSLVMARYERQAHPLLRSLATSVVLASREERDEAQQQQPNVPDARECVSSSTESDTSSVSSSPHWGVSSPPASARLFIPPTGIQLTGDSDPEGRNGDSLPASHRGEPVGQAPPEGIGALAYAMFSSSRCPSLASSSPGHSGRPGGLTSSSGTTSVSAPGTASSVSPETGISPSVFPSDWKRPVAGSEKHAVGLDMPLARGPTSAVSLPSPANAGSPESAQQSCLCFTDPSTRPSLSASPSNSRSWKGTIYKNDECLSSTANGGRPTNCADEDEDARRRTPWGIQKETRPAQEVASDSVQRIGVFSKSPLPASTKESREKEGVCGERYQCGFACNGEEVQEARA